MAFCCKSGGGNGGGGSGSVGFFVLGSGCTFREAAVLLEGWGFTRHKSPFNSLFPSLSHFSLILSLFLCLISLKSSLSFFVSFLFNSLFVSLSHFSLILSFFLCLISL